MAKFRLISDTHLELTRKNHVKLPALPDDKETVLLLAGDIGTWKQATGWMIEIKERFAHIVFILGNHEYYGHEIYHVQSLVRERLSAHSNLHLLENDQLELDDCIVLGATLWTDMNSSDTDTMTVCAQEINDYKVISIGSPETKRKLQPQDTVAMFHETMAYFERMVDAVTKPVVIVTHHAPRFDAPDYLEKFGDDPIRFAFATDLTDWISNHANVVAWCHGHTHQSGVYGISLTASDTNIITNSKGYAGEDTGYDPNFSFSFSVNDKRADFNKETLYKRLDALEKN
jgi:predicted phosphohydrolase